jgi:hypothetical protein
MLPNNEIKNLHLILNLIELYGFCMELKLASVQNKIIYRLQKSLKLQSAKKDISEALECFCLLCFKILRAFDLQIKTERVKKGNTKNSKR